MTSAANQGGGGAGTELPAPIREYLKTNLSDEQRKLLTTVRDKLTELQASDTMKAQVV